ncbi:U-box domain-containing protein 4-like [Salvia splendens]|uniref:U-box domain-containing protein 4-like n=1 Tax=Salvia splendens TaxID=180675 RepID=UPI001100B459|nr:U-box domain-containing protein 4-like [Salvia splendens]
MEAAMAEALLRGEIEAQIAAARAIGNLNTMQKKRVAENGAISSLIMMLHAQHYDSIEASLFALLNLAFGSERNKLLIAEAGAIPALLKIIKWRNESLMELSLAALLILSSCSRNKLEIASSGAIQLLVELLDSLSQNVGSNQAKIDVVSTLHNLSTSPQIIPLIVACGGAIVLIRLVYELDKSSDLVEKAMVLLESLVSSSQLALNQVSERDGAIEMVVEAVEEGTAACREHAAGVLLAICKSSRETYRGLILREGAMPGLLQLSIDGTWLARKKAKALLLLLREDDDNSSLSSSSSRGKHSKNAVFKEVMRKIDRAGTSLQMVEEMIAKLRT